MPSMVDEGLISGVKWDQVPVRNITEAWTAEIGRITKDPTQPDMIEVVTASTTTKRTILDIAKVIAGAPSIQDDFDRRSTEIGCKAATCVNKADSTSNFSICLWTSSVSRIPLQQQASKVVAL